MIDLLLATNNSGKLIEMVEILSGLNGAPLPFNLRLPKDLGIHLDVVEDGQTYAENAAKKALAFCQVSGLITVADDSGLEVDALHGAPGLYSARYAPPDPTRPGHKPTDADRRRYLLMNLAQHPQPWPAHFHCTIAIATPDGRQFFADGNCPGQIIAEERGTSGFGYDPIFMLPEYNQTMAELGLVVKNTLSHRARALQAALPVLLTLAGH
jgi:XTP/dITP diphosphohydrolase